MLNNFITLKQILEGYKKKEFTSREVFASFYDKINERDPIIKSFITKLSLEDLTLNDFSMPIAYKDNFSTKGILTTAGSGILKDYIPPFNATVVEKLRNSGFVCIGKLNCDAFAHGTTGENSDFFATKNPYSLERTPGGSSSGSAAAVAAGFVPVATATDTGGSIRLPASFTNTVGIKPTYGRVSRYGIIAMTSSTDSIGHITKTVWDNAFVLNITAGHDPKDATSSCDKTADYLSDIEMGMAGLTIGIPKEYLKGLSGGIKDCFNSSIKTLEKLGAKLVGVSLPHTEYAINAYYIITPSEISSNLARFDGIRFGTTRESFGSEAKRRIMLGTYSLAAGYYDDYYLKAQKARTLVIKDFKRVFEKVDVLAAPVSPGIPPKLGEVVNDPIKMYMMDTLTVPANLAGVPALSVPAGFVNKLPVGIQFIGKNFSEKLLYRVGHAFEQETKYRSPKR
ncbi:Asp-tRNA(Asn)/Glu-tRNA(Gln) amidotransferase GatCAB subunit A [candidate division WWE3 bacterium CG09_land_8_20_14_0_10_39_24]|uniref:Glutamyl-tRNA(Gln) amidotransferase subunit A n=2 Tax=Katanobacteria TaxID=422282 RepID=A0A2G9XBD6_UNCKA|nr:MAG: glutaminyl-tRNA synthase (glutamine-hydrolyzing) subunit A [bacterium CG09_39_24]PIP04298.1 MAG: Asp-tRNA(Asn)/Glu-tRNA(Gln) amidotransferase GatCAB subunit A [candidate division WWE3 bacterium CG23_combo_of_CG06-09_8_20_14_all_40_14]PIS12722.1 MAG: Asp-tRNA(Asn)/Glu-tRNA(Gln) amidotransferase GatCAB subunit A [candidate division WWE3 bacterium CG09_land_8_20_14_0_10_39_24]